MSLKTYIPSPENIVKEGLIVMGGAIMAAVIIGQVPALRDWIKAQWGDAQRKQS
jgi:hypothetical protein